MLFRRRSNNVVGEDLGVVWREKAGKGKEGVNELENGL